MQISKLFGAVIPLLCASAALGQPALNCALGGGPNTPIRAEGLAEFVGDLIVSCTGGTPTAQGAAVPAVNTTVSLNTSITSRILAGVWSEALLLVDEPSPASLRLCGTTGDTESSPGVCTVTGTGTGAGVYSGAAGRPNVFQATQSAGNALLWTGVPIDPPGNGSRYFRITNVRVNANAYGVTGQGAPVSAFATVTASPANLLPLTSPTSAVASVQKGFAFSVNPLKVFQQCTSENQALALDPGSNGVSQFSLRFNELFPTVFKRRNPGTTEANPAGLQNNNDLSPITYASYSETGFYNSSFPTPPGRGAVGLAGLSDSGTGLIARFTNIPAGVLLYSQASITVMHGESKDVVRLVSTDVNGAGPYSAIAGNAHGIAPVPVTNGAATVVYELVESDAFSIATVNIPMYVAFVANAQAFQPQLGTALVTATFAPLSTTTAASGTEPVPRFPAGVLTLSAFTVEVCSCVTLGTPSANFAAAGGPGALSVTGGPSCQWSSFSLNDWITAPLTGRTGNATVNYTVAANNSLSPRSGRIWAGGEFTVNQEAGVCSFIVSPTTLTIAPGGETGSITATTNIPVCPRSVSTSAPWISLLGGGIGSGPLTYWVAVNWGGPRSGTITIGGQTVTVTQQAHPGPSAVSASPMSGGAASRTFVFKFYDPDGWQNLSVVNVLINNFLDGRQACYLAYDRANNVMYLVNDPGTAITGIVLNGSGSVNNSQCTVNGAGSSAVGSGDTLTLTVALSFNQNTFGGEKVTYMAARDVNANNSGWRVGGVHSVPLLTPTYPAIVGLSPNEGGTWWGYVFTVRYRDAASSANLCMMQLLFNRDLNGNAACYLGYDHANNLLYLVNDANTGLLPALQQDVQGLAENSQCSVYGFTKVESGTDVELRIEIYFKSSFTGLKVGYGGVQTVSGANSDWHALGTWIVPPN